MKVETIITEVSVLFAIISFIWICFNCLISSFNGFYRKSCKRFYNFFYYRIYGTKLVYLHATLWLLLFVGTILTMWNYYSLTLEYGWKSVIASGIGVVFGVRTVVIDFNKEKAFASKW